MAKINHVQDKNHSASPQIQAGYLGDQPVLTTDNFSPPPQETGGNPQITEMHESWLLVSLVP
jgi:hypothetical protein